MFLPRPAVPRPALAGCAVPYRAEPRRLQRPSLAAVCLHCRATSRLAQPDPAAQTATAIAGRCVSAMPGHAALSIAALDMSMPRRAHFRAPEDARRVEQCIATPCLTAPCRALSCKLPRTRRCAACLLRTAEQSITRRDSTGRGPAEQTAAPANGCGVSAKLDCATHCRACLCPNLQIPAMPDSRPRLPVRGVSGRLWRASPSTTLMRFGD